MRGRRGAQIPEGRSRSQSQQLQMAKEPRKNQKGEDGVTTTRSSKAGLQFPVGRIHRHLRDGRYARRVAGSSPVFLAAVLEYLVTEILELAGNAAIDLKKTRITPRHIMLAVRRDEELNKLFRDATIASAGVMPYIHPSLENSHKKKPVADSQEY